ncbi:MULTISPECIES: Stp1/IreP family PP2C-type Ser/Thr phosphatase [unclassified Streptococcus]|uniref:Stp1/IreP family PP2C-type Ser/Thr phosphatase n=1 Tax=unclassified Streptococcus TaxID=2608887 RepID=UPI0018CA4AE9|nr:MULTISPECIES: Stp1/IreP family PP2C-type Ser/Thr phosphatase [unclassified Streptococcus]MBG9367762.1 Stp1/IreP family PP2C-type Ser/Thr phosphatase [Streptococcus sp. NLN64]MBJ6745960.1 Stp1/IreP family PP2C-type Ser/Thr phosphatase [Streptococcus sp. 121]
MEIALLTDVGQRRSNNQDFVNQFRNHAGNPLIVLADGMGGHRAGNIASEMAVTDLGAAWVNTDINSIDTMRAWFETQLEIENQKIHAMGQEEEFRGMGTTLDAVAIIGNQAVFAHVGDSRVSIWDQQEYIQLTSDHSLVNELLKAGQITEEEAMNHPQKNIITQSIGQQDPVKPDIGLAVLQEGDYLIINSDGLTNMVTNQQIKEILASELSLHEKAETLVQMANDAGGLDNISVALVRYQQEDRL